jgi:hypothetical protein
MYNEQNRNMEIAQQELIQEVSTINEEGLSHLCGSFKEADYDPEYYKDVLLMYVNYWDTLQRDDLLPPLFLREPKELAPDILDRLSVQHMDHYLPEINSLVEKYSEWDNLVFRSGMYGGKTSFVFTLLDKLEREKSVSNTLLVADVMDENSITGRGYIGGSKRREALRFGLDNYRSQKGVDSLVSECNEVVVLDEYTFLESTVVNSLVSSCERFNKKLILLGLDTNAFGEELPIFKDLHFKKLLKRDSTRVIDCNSYIDINDEKPSGLGSIRYFKIPNTQMWALDLGILPLVISKELVEVVKYYPSLLLLVESFRNEQFLNLLKTPMDDSFGRKGRLLKYISSNGDRIQE